MSIFTKNDENWSSNDFSKAWSSVTQRVKDVAAAQRKQQKAQQAQQAAPKPSNTYTVTTTKGKQYTFDDDAYNWISNRYFRDNADSYGLDDADQYAKRTGQMSASMRKSYKNSTVDQKLAEMGLPSEKNFEKYLGEYNKWHTGGMDQVYGNAVSSEQWAKMGEMYKRDWTYDNTVEDQTRKALGLVPTKLLAEYADTELDESLMARGLPSSASLSKYNDQYNNYKGIDALYKNAAGAITSLRVTPTDDGKYITDDDQRYTIGGQTMTGKQWYAKAFFDELERTDEQGNQVYASLMPLFKNSNVGGDAGIDPTGDYANERGKIITAYAKNAGNAADYDNYNAFSYDDFSGKYGDYYDKYFKNVKDDNGQTVGGFLDAKAREADAEREKAFYTVEDKWFDGDKGIDAFVGRYMESYPGNSPEQMFTDMLEHGVSEKTVKKAMRALANSAKENRSEDGTSGFYDIKDAYAKAKSNYDAKNKKVDDGHTEELDMLYGPNGYDVVDGKVIPKAVEEPDAKAKYNAADKSRKEYVKTALKEAEDDQATIDATTSAIQSALSSTTATDVDTVLDVIKSVEKQDFTNPVAVQLALTDLGFTGRLSGFADDLTQGWSQEDKNKLAFYLGGAQLTGQTTEDYFYDFNRAEGDSLGDTWADYGYVEDRRKLKRDDFAYNLEWAQEQIAKGEAAGEVYNVLAGAGFQEELEAYMPEEWRKAIFTDVTVPRMYEQAGGDNLAAWELMSPAERKATAEKMWNEMSAEEKAKKYQNADWWKYDPDVYRTTGQAFEQQLTAVLPEFINNTVTSGVQLADSVLAGLSGRPEMWDTTKDLMKVQQGLAQFGKVYDETNGAAVADMVGTAAGEFLRMYTLGAVGSIAGEAFGATKAGTALANAAKNAGSWGVRKLADIGLSMATTLPFVVSSYAGSYAEAKAQGLSNGDAALYGATMGVIEGVTEGLNVDRVWGKAFGSDKFGKMIADGAKTVLGMSPVAAARLLSIPISGISEVTEELMSYTAETLWKQNINADSWGETPWDFKGFFKEAGLISFITGAVGAGVSSGSITMKSLLTDYALTDSDAFHQVFGQDLCTSIALAENLPKSALEAYEKGGATMLSQEAYKFNEGKIEECNDGIESAGKTRDAAKVNAKNELDSALLEIDKVRSKLLGVDVQNADSVHEFMDLCNRLGIKIDLNQPIAQQAATALDARVKSLNDAYNTAIERADTTYENDKRQKEELRAGYEKKRQEHFVGMYLANRDGIIAEMPDELIKNVAKTYQEGGKYDPDVAAEQRAAREAKLAEAEANETVAEAEQAAQTPEDAVTKARELAYNRVYKDQEAGKAYAEGRRGENDSKMTRVQFAENERQNFQAKTTARLRRVTLELAGLEAKDGMSAKEIFAEAKKAMTPEAAQKLEVYQKLSKALGLNMVIRDVVAGTSGYVHDGKLYVTLNGKQSMLRVAAHELTHYMKDYASEQYDALRNSLVNEVGQEKFDEMLADKAQEYGLDLNDSKARMEADDEVCAELCERMLENQDALERFVQSDLDAAKTLKQRLGKTLVAIKSAIRTLNISADTKNDLIKEQETIEKWYKGLSDAIDNANKAKGKSTATTSTETETVTDTTTEAPQAPPVETNPDLFMGEESARREQLRTELEELAKRGTRVKGLSYQEVNDVLDRVIMGDKSNYNKADYAQIRGMLAQLIPEVQAFVNGDESVDSDVLNERVSAALDYMLERYSEGSEDYYGLRDLIPNKIALTEAAYNELRARDMTLRQASNELRNALGGKFVSFVYKKSPDYYNAMSIDELWTRITDAYGEPDGYGNVQEDALALIDYAKGRNTRTTFDDLYGSQREDVVNAQVGEFLDAVQSMVEGKNAEQDNVRHYVDISDSGIIPATDDEARTLPMTDERNIARYRNEVDDVLSGRKTASDGVLIGRPGALLQKYLGSDNPLRINLDVIRKIAYPTKYFGGKHNLGLSVVKQLPYQLEHPLAITENTDYHKERVKQGKEKPSIVCFTEWVSDDGERIVIPIGIDENGSVELKNDVRSIINATEDYEETLIGKPLYPTTNKQDIVKLLSNRRKLPRAMVDDIFANSIFYEGDTVNTEDGKKSLGFTKQRVDDLLNYYGASMPTYSKAYATYISPKDFLSLTTNDLSRIGNESRPLDVTDLQGERREMFLHFDPETGEVTGHEGRHRMFALMQAGIDQAAITLIPDGSEGRYDRKRIDSLHLTGQTFNGRKAVGDVTVSDVIPVSQEYREQLYDKFGKAGIRYSLDDDYMPLAEKYDAGIAKEEEIAEMQRDVDEAARDNGYTIKAYHGTTEDFTEFNRGTQGQNHDGYLEFGGGFYFTPDAGEAREWVSRGRSGMSGEATPRVMAVYLNPGRILGADDAVPGGADYLRSMWLSSADANFIANRAYRFINYLTEERGFSNTEVQDTLKALGFDAIDATFGQGKSGQYVVFDPEQIKSTDPVTYDDNGDIIPLSERFNPDSRDIRWSVDDDLVQQYGAIEQGREPRARDVQVPRQSADNMRVSKFTRSLDESSKVNNAQSAEIESEIGSEADRVKQLWSYIPKSNDETMRKAKEFIAARQPATAQREFHDMVVAGKYGTRTAAIGLQLLSDASARDDWASVKDIAYDLRVLATEAGQSAQIFNVLKDLKGVGSAWYVEKLVNSLNSTYADEIQSGQMDPITVSDEAMQRVRAAKTQEEVDAAERIVADEIGPQLPLKRDEKLSNWRYLSMLGNPVTHIRNVTGNNLMYGMGGIKDVVASGIQRLLEGTGITDEGDRTFARLSRADKAYWDKFAQESYNEQKRNLQGGGKLGFQSLVQQSKRSFDNKVLDAIARGKDPGTMSERKGLVGLLQNIRNNGAMGMLEVEDAWGLEKNYKRSLMEYMKAQGYSLNDEGKVGKVGKDGSFTEITNEQMNKAIEWATNQAWTNTFRGPSALATELNKISKMNTASKLIVEGVMPFKKTPVNIAKQGAMYSPAGIVIGTTELLTKVKQGKMSAAKAIDHLSSGLTGTALMALGVVLAKAGILRGGGEDKKKLETYLEDTGDQTYAFKFGNVSINMSAIAPATIPLFMGVALQEMLSRNGEDEGVDLSTITDVLAGTLNPFMEMSFMSSLNSALKNYNNEGIGGALGSTIMTAAQNYGSQYLPTLGGKVAQFVDPTQRTTKSSATSPVGGNLDYYWRSLVKKVPGAEATLQPDVNIWGQTTTKDSFGDWALDFANKFILPTTVKVTNRDAVDQELIRIVESTGEVDFLPSDGAKYFKVKGETYKMNAKQYTEYSQERGQAAYAALKEVMMSPSYQAATDGEKYNMLKKAIDAAYKQVNTTWKEKLGAFDK